MTKKITIITPIVILISILSVYIILESSDADFKNLTMASNPSKYDGLTVQGIDVVGNKLLTEEEVLRDIGLKVGDTFLSSRVNNSIRNMFSGYKYERAAIDVEQIDSKNIKLKIIVSEQPIVSSIYFNGNKKINNASLTQDIEEYIKVGGTYSPQRLNEAANIIISNYQSKGYLKVYLSPNVKENEEDLWKTFQCHPWKAKRRTQFNFPVAVELLWSSKCCQYFSLIIIRCEGCAHIGFDKDCLPHCPSSQGPQRLGTLPSC